jgi:BirA family transcriptional regulator, biotin operon repressor / biotin---[acetyl-CoA-carboxylase] ligase
LATPYFQLRFDDVPSTQDVARERIADLPLLVAAASQTEGRGRSGTKWDNAERSLAVSMAFHDRPGDTRPVSLMAGVAAVRCTTGTTLKWPNDVLVGGAKVGGILVERGSGVTVVGMGLNLWWAVPPPHGASSVFDSDPGEEAHLEIGALWGAELMGLIESSGWPIEEYRDACVTLGSNITWEPDGAGQARDVTDDGALVVVTDSGEERLYSGAVRHVRG